MLREQIFGVSILFFNLFNCNLVFLIHLIMLLIQFQLLLFLLDFFKLDLLICNVILIVEIGLLHQLILVFEALNKSLEFVYVLCNLFSDFFDVLEVGFEFDSSVVEFFVAEFLLHVSVIVLFLILFLLLLKLFLLNLVKSLLLKALNLLNTNLSFENRHLLI